MLPLVCGTFIVVLGAALGYAAFRSLHLLSRRFVVLVPAGVNQARVRAELEKIASDLMVDLTLGPAK